MPEYSSTPITPADSVKVPAMNGGTSGNFQLDALRNFILASKGQANGLASLGADGKLTAAQLPDLADDVLVYGSYPLLPSPGIAGKLYITADNNRMYRWDDALATPAYVELSVDLSAYATKAELAAEESAREAEESAREAEDTNLKNALDSTNARVENLEQEHGSYQEVTAKSPYTIPSGKAKNWSVNVLRGVTRGKNQLIPDNRITYTFTVSQNITQDQWGSNFLPLAYLLPYVGHTVLAFRKPHNDKFYVAFGNTADAFTSGKAYGNQGDPLSGVYTLTNTLVGSSGQLYIRYLAGLQAGTYTSEIYLVDLTQYFGTNDLSFLGATDAEKLATIQTNYPELLVPSAYGNSLVSTTYEGVKRVGVNIWDEEWQNGYWNIANGQFVTESRFLGCKNLIKVTQGETYYFKFPVVMELCGFDANGNFVQSLSSSIANISLQIPMGVSFIAFSSKSANALTTYGNNIQICLNSYADKTTYHPYMTDTLALPTPVTLRSAGSVADTDELNVEIDGVEKRRQTTRVTTYTFTGNETWTWNGSTFWYMSGYTQISKLDAVMASNGIILSTFATSAIVRVYVSDNPQISSSTDMNALFKSGVVMGYPLATESVTLLAPIQNPYLPTESGGTISSILTDAVDDSMTLGYINL